MAKEAVTKALNDSGLQISDIKQACVGYVYGMYFFGIIIILIFLCFQLEQGPPLSISGLYRLTPDHDFPHCKASSTVLLQVCPGQLLLLLCWVF